MLQEAEQDSALQVQSICSFFVRWFVCSFLPSFCESFCVGGRDLTPRKLTCRGGRAGQEPCSVQATGDLVGGRKKTLIPVGDIYK